MKLLHFCEEDRATSWQRSESFKVIEIFDVSVLWHTPLYYKFSRLKRLLHSVFHKIKIPIDKFYANKRLLDEINRVIYDIVFIEKCLVLAPSTLLKIRKIQPNCKIVLYSLDDFNGRGNGSIYFEKCIPLYDLIATNKKHNVLEYQNAGAKRVYYFRNGYSRFVHRPIVKWKDGEMDNYASQVSFIGTYEKDRAKYILFLAENGVKVTVWGWSRDSVSSGIDHPNIINKGRHVYFDEFAKVISGSKINLNFLRKANRDTETTRTFEIPACMGFMISEKSLEQMEVFFEQIDAVYFSSREELLHLVNFYLENDGLRQEIALNGYNRCISGRFEYEFQLRSIITEALL
jgi:spore maturation protein CgeB